MIPSHYKTCHNLHAIYNCIFLQLNNIPDQSMHASIKQNKKPLLLKNIKSFSPPLMKHCGHLPAARPKRVLSTNLTAPLVDSSPRHSSSAMLMLLSVVLLGLAVFLIYKFKRYASATPAGFTATRSPSPNDRLSCEALRKLPISLHMHFLGVERREMSVISMHEARIQHTEMLRN